MIFNLHNSIIIYKMPIFRLAFNHKEIRTVIYGAVHSLCNTGETKLFSGPILDFKRSLGDSELFIYPSGYEFWFNMPELPVYLNPVRIDTWNDDGVVSATLYLNELVNKYRDKEGSPCTTYADTEDEGTRKIVEKLSR